MIARKKRVAENCFRLFYEHPNQTTAEAKIPDFIGHYLTCFHPKPGCGTLVQYQMKGKHCRQKRTVPSDWDCL